MDFLIPSRWVPNAIISVLELVKAILVQLLSWLGSGMQQVLSIKAGYGGAAVTTVWTILRDTANMFFIVILILIAFGTIFNAIKANPFYYRTALAGVLIAAITINMSLAVGQVIVGAGNILTQKMLDLIQLKDVGARIAATTNLGGIVNGSAQTAPVPVPQMNAPTDQLTVQQQAMLKGWQNAGLSGALNVLQSCLKYNQGTPAQCFAKAQPLAVNDARKVAEDNLAANPTGLAAIAYKALTDELLPSGDKLAIIGQYLMQILMLGSIALSLLAVLLFTFFRIPAIWFFLTMSAPAFFTLAIPGSDWFTKWWRGLVGWTIFSPLYLLVIYFGLYFLGVQGTLVSSIQDGNLPFLTGSLSMLMTFVITGFIFIGGGAMAMKTAFAFSPGAGKLWGGISGFLGADQKGWFGLETLGVKAAYQGARGGLEAQYEKRVSKPYTERQERIEAVSRGIFGDARAYEGLQRKRIEEQIKKNKDAGLSTKDLKDNLKNIGTPEYFAAAKALLDSGDLTPAEMTAYVTAAARVSPSYGRAVKESVEKKLKERAKEKKHKNPADAVAALNMYSPNPGDSAEVAREKTKMRDDILKGLEKNQPLVAAGLVGQGLYPGKTAEQIVEANFSAMEPKDIRSLLDMARAGSVIRTPDMDKLIAGRNRKLADHLNLVADATPQQQVEIQQILTATGIRPRP